MVAPGDWACCNSIISKQHCSANICTLQTSATFSETHFIVGVLMNCDSFLKLLQFTIHCNFLQLKLLSRLLLLFKPTCHSVRYDRWKPVGQITNYISQTLHSAIFTITYIIHTLFTASSTECTTSATCDPLQPLSSIQQSALVQPDLPYWLWLAMQSVVNDEPTQE